jgi:dTDP-4-dehydrorhamnose 3,5-epimerase
MKISSLRIPDIKLVTPKIFKDDRGCFFESFNQKTFNDLLGKDIKFVQDNHSESKKGVVRGVHFQKPPFSQAKLIRVISGEIFDIVVDIRKDSVFFGQWVGAVLSANNANQIWIPEGFAHGFQSLKENTIVAYKASNYYYKDYEICLSYEDEAFNFKWPIKPTNISDKDRNGMTFNDFKHSLEI